VRASVDPREAWRRLLDSLLPAAQIVLAATAAYAIAHYGLEHAAPLLAMTVTISSLGFARDARPRRVLENAVGVVVGIVVSEALLLVIGKGVWQLALVLLVTLLAARFVSANPGFAVAAGTQSMLVMLLPSPDGGPFVRSIDGLIGGAVAIAVTALIPRDPIRLARRDARRLFGVLTGALSDVSLALSEADAAAAEEALERLRATQPLLDAWSASVESARSIARISPFLRRRLPDVEQASRVLRGTDLAIRNLRVIARRTDFLVRDGRERPQLAALVAQLATSVDVLGQSLDDPLLADTARAGLSAVASRLRPDLVDDDAPVTDSALVLMLRPLLVDLLAASGFDEAKARSMLPAV
jgi:uncharacterized membrane protein YgaE (UPF0421/DUF939 family)